MLLNVFGENLVNYPTGTGKWKTSIRICWLVLFVTDLMILSRFSQSAMAQERQVDLAMRLVSHPYSVRATAGKENTFFLEMDNIGNREITDIELSSLTPEGWIVDFRPREIEYIGPSSIHTVDVTIQPPRNAAGPEHKVNFIAEANEIRKVQTFWVTVKSPSRLWIGAGLLLVVIIGFASVYVLQGTRASGA